MTNKLNALIAQLIGRDTILLSWVRDDETQDGYVARIDVEVPSVTHRLRLHKHLADLGHEVSISSDDTGVYLWLRIRAKQIPSLSELRTQLIAAHRGELLHYAGAMHRDPIAYQMMIEWVNDTAAPEHVLKARCLGMTARAVDEARASYDPAAKARISTDYYGDDGWPRPGAPEVIVLPDGTIAQSMERPGDRNNI